MPSKNDEAFGQMAVQANYISKAELKEALAALAKREEAGKRSTLDRVLQDLGMMLAVQVETIQQKQKRRVVFCPACGMKLNVFEFKPGQRIKCTHCQRSLLVPQTGQDPTLAPSGAFPAVKPQAAAPPTRPSAPRAKEEADDLEEVEEVQEAAEGSEDETILEEGDLLLPDDPKPRPAGHEDVTRVTQRKDKGKSPSKTPTRPSIKKPPSKGR